MVKRVGKRGDTLIEVMLAVGIFSMVAIAVVSVMSGGTSNAQTALESTLAREEIDTQAEALRFIHSSYVANKDDENNKFVKLWEQITAKGSTISDNVAVVTGTSEVESIANYSPKECSELYDGDQSQVKRYGFAINTRALGDAGSGNSAIILARNGNMFKTASTYPRLIYSDDSQLVSSNSAQTLNAIEGIYVIAVKDPNTTNIAGAEKQSAYYDFYIRTCWYGTGDQIPSTISTVMRLYDPGIAETN